MQFPIVCVPTYSHIGEAEVAQIIITGAKDQESRKVLATCNFSKSSKEWMCNDSICILNDTII